MKTEQGITFHGLLPSTEADIEYDIKFAEFIESFWCLYRTALTIKQHDSLVTQSILDHCIYFTSRFDNQMYREPSIHKLRYTKDWLLYNDRYEFSSLWGTYAEHVVMLSLLRDGYDVVPAVSKSDQHAQKIDLRVSKPTWKSQVTCQVKSTRVEDSYGYFDVRMGKFKEWLDCSYQRLYISDRNFTFWIDSVLFKEYVGSQVDLTKSSVKLNVQLIHEWYKRNVIGHKDRYGLFENVL